MLGYKHYQLLIATSISLASCMSHEEFDFNPHIDPELDQYVNSFFEEAQSRGIEVDVSLLNIRLGVVENADGITYLNEYRIVIDSTSRDWLSAQREQLVYHELGHLYLKRGHDDSVIGKYPKSIMAGLEDPSYENRNCQHMRKYYVDELFNRNTKRPDWSVK